MSTAAQLRRDALQIWRAGVDAVLPQRLVPQYLRVEGESLLIGDDAIPLDAIGRIVVVGGGKAGGGMAEAVETALGPKLMEEKQVSGWINVPADCARPLQRIHLHAARPAGVNEPMAEGVAGAMEILRLVESLRPGDLCLCLLSGGGSALMPAPVEGITLADKLAITRHLSAAGANIEQLNAVRKQLSRIKERRAIEGVPCRAVGLADYLRRARRPVGHHRLRPHRARHIDAASRVGRARTIRGTRSRHCTRGIRVFGTAALREQSFSRRVHALSDPGVDAGAKRESTSAP